MNYKNYFTIAMLAIGSISLGQQQSKRALFLGNSYTANNNLPNMIAQVAASMGDELIYDSNTPGGQTLNGHYNNTTSMSKIAQGNWDFVVLQEQSQYPSFPEGQVQNSVYPFATLLDQAINQHNPCAETVFYMTWGRKNGDQNNCPGWPAVCTYEGMDDLIRLRYQTMADNNDAVVSPVGAVWRYIRENHPTIELYTSDQSHPSFAGSYAAACTFYAVLFRKDPTLITYKGSLSDAQAQTIREAAKTIAYNDLLQWNVGEYDPIADFTHEATANNLIQFQNQSQNATEYLWDFGDNTTSTETNPTHQYTTPGTYTVQLTATHCDTESTATYTVQIDQLNTPTHDKPKVSLYPNPAKAYLIVSIPTDKIGESFRILDTTGKLLNSGILTTIDTTITTQELARGMYFITIGETLPATYPILLN